MLKILVLATLLSACLADEEVVAQASASPVLVDNHRDEARHRPDHRGGGVRHRQDGRDHHHHVDQYDHPDDHLEDHGPLILRTIRPHDDHHPDIAKQNKIIERVYSPDYAEPTWVLDYRYLKTGGRDYTRGPGGQILILPKGVRTKEKKQFKDYDELIEHLKQKTLEERQKPFYFMPTGEETIEQRLDGVNPNVEVKKDEKDQWWQG